MDVPPPVPPKDARYTAPMEIDSPSHARPGSSKRKREASWSDLYDVQDCRLAAADPEQHTPKRNRSHARQSATEVSDETPSAAQRSVRRKKGSRNLSHLNLRYTAEEQEAGSRESQQAQESPVRGSRFQEGSLTDKPSERPPSVFLKMQRTDSGNMERVEQLMSDYQDGRATQEYSVEPSVKQNMAGSPDAGNNIQHRQEGSTGFFKFGRQIVSGFHPMNLWNKMWSDTRDEMAREAAAEAERKARLKAEAETKYAQMKQAGQLGLQPIGNLAKRTMGDNATPRDSAITLPPLDHQRNASNTSQVEPHKADNKQHMNELAGAKTTKTLKSRLHLKKPSLSNLKGDLKRVKSDLNLGSSTGKRESTSSLSPVKTDLDSSVLRQSHSKFDLKKQSKLTKRVSDLEIKLHLARQELDDALVEASPLPKLIGKHERFTPNSTIRKARYIPDKLPSLPSERILMAQRGFSSEDMNDHQTEFQPDHSQASNISGLSEGAGHDIVKAQPRKQYPTRASDLFNLDNNNIEGLDTTDSNMEHSQSAQPQTAEKASELTQLTSESGESMEAQSVADGPGDPAGPTRRSNYGPLDAKLKALDKNVRTARKSTRSKKRKSGVDMDQKPFKPGQESDDDAEWDQAEQTPRKKRKSTGSKNDSPQTKRSSRLPKAVKRTSKDNIKPSKASELENSPQNHDQGAGSEAPIPFRRETNNHFTEVERPEIENTAIETSTARLSKDSAELLDPVYEEEEASFSIPVNSSPSKPTATATPARYNRGSATPSKQASAEQTAEEELLTRAAEAAQGHQGRRMSRGGSPGKRAFNRVEEVEETFSIEPGVGGVPQLPERAHGVEATQRDAEQAMSRAGAEGESRGEGFDWPEDCF